MSRGELQEYAQNLIAYAETRQTQQGKPKPSASSAPAPLTLVRPSKR
ncbi:hypothetical protein [Microbispora sp. CA-102843]